jgi:uncharacterized protein YebE (UPF0316 family)
MKLDIEMVLGIKKLDKNFFHISKEDYEYGELWLKYMAKKYLKKLEGEKNE